ncbi:hypothetical protein DXN05_01975 [Deminuibacter soli]|uniref:Uncharacterized protein n=1 Tax=Deminuibacter soli TaxID=2291815 RepID=A0A3E1NPA3_9BACT|nr:hypothetical protein DXN05_01975 [Deminuibacter soli]
MYAQSCSLGRKNTTVEVNNGNVQAKLSELLTPNTARKILLSKQQVIKDNNFHLLISMVKKYQQPFQHGMMQFPSKMILPFG